MMIVFDVISRYLRFSGYRVTFVRNFTDIEDKIIRRANQEGVPASEVSERYVAAFRQDIAALGVQAPEVEPKATEHVPEMIALIERLVAGGYAYVVEGDVYFEIRRFPAYGKLSGKNLEDLLMGARVEVDERKRDPRDFALWKGAKPGCLGQPGDRGPAGTSSAWRCPSGTLAGSSESTAGARSVFPNTSEIVDGAVTGSSPTLAAHQREFGQKTKPLGNTPTIRRPVASDTIPRAPPPARHAPLEPA